jgi:hypothetical protein
MNSFIEEQRDRLETLLNDLSVRNQQQVPPSSGSIHSPQGVVPDGSAALPSHSSLVSSAEPSFSNRSK